MNNKVTIKDSWYYQGPLFNHNHYNMSYLTAVQRHVEVENKDDQIDVTNPGKASRYSIYLTRDIETQTQAFNTKTLYGILGTLGGFFGLFTKMVAYIMSYFNGFNLDNSMTKRLYSTHDEDYTPKRDTLVKDEGTTEEQKNAKISEKMFNDIKSRKPFSARYWPFYIRKNCLLKYLLC